MGTLSPGSMLERYEIVRLVGRGGMGEVYHATDSVLRRPVALKVLRADKDQSAETGTGGVARLLREARAAAALNHPNSVGIYELGEADGVAYIAMELVTGESFRRHAQNQSVSVETKLGWLIDAARALWAAHKTGIIHRDIKPSNIMVSEEGIVKVLDFGLAKPFAPNPAMAEPGFQTVMGQVLGTPRYMSPEQLEGHPPDARADQYAFGLTAYELLCGEYAGGPLAGAPKPLHEVSPAIPFELSLIIQRTLMRHAHDRFETMEEVAHGLRGCIPVVQAVRYIGGGIGETTTRDLVGGAARDARDAVVANVGANARAVAPSAPPPTKRATDPPITQGAMTLRMSGSGSAQRIDTPPLPQHSPLRAPTAATVLGGSDGGVMSRPNTPATLPLARPLNISSLLPPSDPQQPHASAAGHAHAHAQHAHAVSPSPIIVPTPPSQRRPSTGVSVASGVFPAGSAPAPSVPRPSFPVPSARAEVGPVPKRTGWIAIVIAVGLIALTLGAALAITLR